MLTSSAEALTASESVACPLNDKVNPSVASKLSLNLEGELTRSTWRAAYRYVLWGYGEANNRRESR